jgi:hypothetical protein
MPRRNAFVAELAKLPTLKACKEAGTHMLRCTGDGYCKVCFDREPADEANLISISFEDLVAASEKEVLPSCR